MTACRGLPRAIACALAFAVVAIPLGSRGAATGQVQLSIGPWTGPALNGTIPGTTKYALHVFAPRGATIRLKALDVPKGWIASFCTTRVCAPFGVTMTLARGRDTIELQFIKNYTSAKPPTNVHIIAIGAGAKTELLARFHERRV